MSDIHRDDSALGMTPLQLAARAGHAAVVRDDGEVFIHLHPMGTISPAAQARLSPVSMHGGSHAKTTRTDTLRFPYAFPEPGQYSVWVQVKRKGRILTGSFRVDVK